MKKNILLLLMSLVFFLSSDAQAYEWYEEGFCCVDETNFYARVLGGVNFLKKTKITRNRTTYQSGYLIAGSLGYRWCNGLRLEAEYAFRRNAIKKTHYFVEGFSDHGHFQASSYMGNLIWDLPLSSWGCECENIQPFIGAGIGHDFQQMRSCNSRVIFKQNWKHLSWQLMAGLTYSIFCNAEMTVDYTFHQGGSHFNNHSIGVGLLYKFDFLR